MSIHVGTLIFSSNHILETLLRRYQFNWTVSFLADMYNISKHIDIIRIHTVCVDCFYLKILLYAQSHHFESNARIVDNNYR